MRRFLGLASSALVHDIPGFEGAWTVDTDDWERELTLPERDTDSACSTFFKAHGLGNDYLVFEAGDDWVLDGEKIVAVCDRWRGSGSDGIVLLLDRTSRPFPLRMFNPDGSEFERSGNGLRILAAYLAREGLVGDEPFDVSVGGDVVRLQVSGPPEHGLYDVSAEMGRAGHGPGAVGLDPGALDENQTLDLGEAGSPIVHPVSIGNPHAVVFPVEWKPGSSTRSGRESVFTLLSQTAPTCRSPACWTAEPWRRESGKEAWDRLRLGNVGLRGRGRRGAVGTCHPRPVRGSHGRW